MWMCVCVCATEKCVCSHLDRIYCWPIHFQPSSIVLGGAFPFRRIIFSLPSIELISEDGSVSALYSLGFIHFISFEFFLWVRDTEMTLVYTFKHGFTAWIAHDDFPINSYRPHSKTKQQKQIGGLMTRIIGYMTKKTLIIQCYAEI